LLSAESWTFCRADIRLSSIVKSSSKQSGQARGVSRLKFC
jgi:hypothetical protein